MNLNKLSVLILVVLGFLASGCRTPEGIEETKQEPAAPAPPTEVAQIANDTTKVTSNTDQEMLEMEKNLERYQKELDWEEIEEEFFVRIDRSQGYQEHLVLVELDGQEKIIDNANAISVLAQKSPWVVYQKNTALILYNFKAEAGKDQPLHQGSPYPDDRCDWKVVWSPDGSKLAYSAPIWPIAILFVYDLETKKDTAFFYASLTDNPTWTEEGLEIWKWQPIAGSWDDPDGIEIDKTEIINP